MREAVVDAARFLAARSAEPITLGDVADHVGYSPFHLARAFERQLGMPPGRLLAAHRFQRAKRLLLSGDQRIIDVCHAVGFTSVGTFTTRFTAAVGRTPLEFRRLPDLLANSPPRPVVVPGWAPEGGTVTGSVQLSPRGSPRWAGPPRSMSACSRAGPPWVARSAAPCWAKRATSCSPGCPRAPIGCWPRRCPPWRISRLN